MKLSKDNPRPLRVLGFAVLALAFVAAGPAGAVENIVDLDTDVRPPASVEKLIHSVGAPALPEVDTPPIDRLPPVKPVEIDTDITVEEEPVPTADQPVYPQVEPCDYRKRAVFTGGTPDEWAAGAPEVASPRPALANHIAPTPTRDFDEGGLNKHFGHSFTGLPDQIQTATLQIRMKAEGVGVLAHNDNLALQLTGSSFEWGRRIGTDGITPGIHAQNWDNVGPYTFNLNLAALPNANGGPTNLLPSLNANGYLDVFVQDDTSIDYVQLYITYCVCHTADEYSVTAGAADNFALPTEAASPRADLAQFMNPAPTRDFDQTGLNMRFGHSFSGLPTNILSATLEIRMQSDGILARNDGISLQYNGQNFDWGRRIGTFAGTPGLLAQNWENFGGPNTFFLNLDALPNVAGAPTSLLNSMEQNGYLDIYVQDDTSIDYIRLNIVHCICYTAEDFGYAAGIADDFAGEWEPTYQRPSYASYLAPRYLRDFDEPGNDKHFAHSFTGFPANLAGATLSIRFKAEGGLAYNDGLSLMFNGAGHEWGRRIGTTGNVQGLLPFNWDPSAGTQTIVLDLDALPLVGGGTTSILAAMQAAGALDVFVQDDTNIDYIKLHLVGCGCVAQEAGTKAKYGAVQEGTSPYARPGFSDWLSTKVTRSLGEEGWDKAFGTTIEIECGTVKEAFLTLTMTPHHGLASNDWLHLQFTGSSPAFEWGIPISTLVGGAWNTFGTTTVTLDLANLPTGGYGGPSIVAAIDAVDALDIYIQDDTSVQAAVLTVVYG